jgi:hypothetical protein
MTRSIRLLLPAIATIALCAILPDAANAQACAKGCDLNSVPLDGGQSILLAAGLGLGIIKVLKNKKAGREKKAYAAG